YTHDWIGFRSVDGRDGLWTQKCCCYLHCSRQSSCWRQAYLWAVRNRETRQEANQAPQPLGPWLEGQWLPPNQSRATRRDSHSNSSENRASRLPHSCWFPQMGQRQCPPLSGRCWRLVRSVSTPVNTVAFGSRALRCSSSASFVL